MGAGAGLDVLENTCFSCSCQDLNPISTSIYPSHCTDCAARYRFEDNTEVRINKVRWEVGIGCV